jgi:DNA repair protein RecO (recombination protein O)
MVTEGQPVWMLHKIPSGDTSAYVNFFTKDQGLIRCLYKGGLTSKKHSILQPFIPLWLIMNIRSDRYYVRQLDAINQPLPLKGVSLFAALYLNEILYQILKPLDPYPELFETYQEAVDMLASSNNIQVIEGILRRFEWHLIKNSGYGWSWTVEAENGEAIVAENKYYFIAGKGFITNEKGISGAAILTLSKGELKDLITLKTAKFIMRQAIDHLLGGKKLYTRELFRVS